MRVCVCRIFSVGYRVFSDGQWSGFPDGMSYQDFIYFMLSEEDKTSPNALRYWFHCCDLDGDRQLSPEEMRFFYRNQIHRITSLVRGRTISFCASTPAYH